MKINNFLKIDNKVIKGKFDLEFENWGITIRECTIMDGKNGLWVSYPAKMYEKDGVKKYYNYVVFEKEVGKKIQDEIISRLKTELEATPTLSKNDNIPF